MSLLLGQLSSSDPTTALHLSQKAPNILANPAPSSRTFPLSILETPESPETWKEYEGLFLACLRTGDDHSAHKILERLTKRFGAGEPRVLGLRGLFEEAVADNLSELEDTLKEYEKILSENPMNVPILKRRIALKSSMHRPQEAISDLVGFLENCPTDAEAWCELADLYQSQGMGPQSIFSLEEALLIAPNAWNSFEQLHARLGELEYILSSSSAESPDAAEKLLSDSVQRFSRSIELCDDYVRGYYGLKMSSGRLLETLSASKQGASAKASLQTAQRLNELATRKLTHIVKSWSHRDHTNPKLSEIIAAKELLQKSK